MCGRKARDDMAMKNYDPNIWKGIRMPGGTGEAGPRRRSFRMVPLENVPVAVNHSIWS